MLPPGCRDALSSLRTILKGYGSVAIAFSGGVDSTLLLQLALMSLGPQHVLALYASSDLVKDDERTRALTWLRVLEQRCRLRFLSVDWQPLSIASIRQNSSMRCYFCKEQIFSLLQQLQHQYGMAHLLDGSNADDLLEHRPGLQAVRELGVQSPLAAAGCSKACIRYISRRLGLPTWNMPSASCLATRIPVDTAISIDQLLQIARLESAVEALGYKGCRVRLLSAQADSVLVELDPVYGKELAPAAQTFLEQTLLQLGVRSVSLQIARKSRLGAN